MNKQYFSCLGMRSLGWCWTLCLVLGVIMTSVAQDLPNLKIVNARLNKTRLQAGEKLDLSFKVLNLGGYKALGNTVGIYASEDNMFSNDDALLTTQRVGQLLSGEKAEYDHLSVDQDLSPGVYFILVIADHDSKIGELSETDNMASPMQIVIDEAEPLLLTDISVRNLEFSKSSIDAGQNLEVSFELIHSNPEVGYIAVDVDYYLDYQLNGETYTKNLYSRTNVGLNPGKNSEVYNVNIPSIEEEANTFKIRVHVESEIDQNTRNNSISNAINVNYVPEPQADLIVSSQSISGNGVISQGEQLYYSYSIKNQGEASTGGGHYIRVYLSKTGIIDGDAIQILNSYKNYLNSNASTSSNNTYTIPFGITPGTYYLIFQTDTYNYITESNEDNNVTVSSSPIVIKEVSASDLIVKTLEVEKSKIKVGESMEIEAEVINQGAGDPSFYIYTYVYLATLEEYNNRENMNYYNYQHGFYSLNNGSMNKEGEVWYGSLDYTIPSDIPSGTYYILVQTGEAQDKTESDISNNFKAIPITVVGRELPNIIISKKSLSQPNFRMIDMPEQGVVHAGDERSFVAEVLNIGAGDMTDGAYVSYFISDNQVLDASDYKLQSEGYISYLEAGEKTSVYKTVTIPYSVGSGSKYIIFYADGREDVNETNEKDNFAVLPITILPSSVDLLVENPEYTPKFAVSNGGRISVDMDIVNQGKDRAAGNYVKFYLSEDKNWDEEDIVIGDKYVDPIYGDDDTYLETELYVPDVGAQVGTYYLFVKVDAYDEIDETNEDNNLSMIGEVEVIESLPYIDMSSQAMTVCDEGYRDPGGSNNYSNYINLIQTFTPATEGKMLQFTFTEFITESCCDYLRVYDGANTSASLIGEYRGSNNPGTITATNAEGKLTFWFYSDYSVVESGWEGYFECVEGSQNVLRTASENAKLTEELYNEELLSESKDGSVKIYPNPTISDEVLLEVSEAWQGAELSVFNMNGIKVLEGKVSAESIKLDLSGKPSGFYLIKLQLGEQIKVLRLLKK